MKVDVLNQKNEKAGTVELPEQIFGVKWNPTLVHQALTTQVANSREILAHAKGRGEVRGGGKKPWRQKGTGRARHGSIRSPLWSGGGVTFGPSKERVFARKINKKMKKLAIFSVLSRKLKDGELKIVDSLKMEDFKTKNAVELLKKILGRTRSSLLISSKTNKGIKRAVSNIEKTGALSSESLNVSDLLKYKNIILEQPAIKEIENHYLRKRSETTNTSESTKKSK